MFVLTKSKSTYIPNNVLSSGEPNVLKMFHLLVAGSVTFSTNAVTTAAFSLHYPLHDTWQTPSQEKLHLKLGDPVRVPEIRSHSKGNARRQVAAFLHRAVPVRWTTRC